MKFLEYKKKEKIYFRDRKFIFGFILILFLTSVSIWMGGISKSKKESSVSFFNSTLSNNNYSQEHNFHKQISLTNNTKDTISLFYFDYYSDLISINIFPASEYKINTDIPLWLFDNRVKHSTPYLLRPGDSLSVFFGENKDVFLVADEYSRKNELDIFRHINHQFSKSYYEIIFDFKNYKYDLEMFNLRKEMFKERASNSILALKKFITSKNLGKSIESYSTNIIKLEFYSKTLLGLWGVKYFSEISNKNKELFDSVYTALLNDSLDNTISPIPYRNVKYSYFVRHVQFEMGQNPFEKSEYQKPPADTLYKFALNEIHNKAQLDYFLFLIVKDELLKYPKSSQKCLQTFFNDCKNELYKKYISEMLLSTQTRAASNSGDTFIRADKTETNFSTILNSFKGQVVYLDIWASWCAPCRSEMPAAAKLREKYKDEQIQFLYISIDNNFNLWNKAIIQEELNVFSNSYLLLDFENSDFKKKFRVGPIPRYLVIDKLGNVIISEAPRPSEESLSQILDDMLK
ncbi:MAG: TlpA disulfide reductase family protein [Chitinophagaceae bacterium]